MTTVLLGVLSTVGIIMSAYATYRATVKAKEIESEATPYAALASRVSEMEKKVDQLYREQYEDRAYMRRMLSYWPGGVPLPQRMPDWLEEHVPPEHQAHGYIN